MSLASHYWIAVLAQGSRPMPADPTIGNLVPVLQSLARELYPGALRRVLSGERGDPQRSEGATWAGAFEADYAELDPDPTAPGAQGVLLESVELETEEPK